jgi:arylsulfatase A-like enzyme
MHRSINQRWILLHCLAASVFSLVFDSRSEAAPDKKPTPPNVVMIISDDQGAGDYGFMGHPHIRTPELDRLARESLTFRNGYVTTSLCRPSLATILTGLYPHQHKITSNDPPLPAGKTNREANKDPTFLAGRQAMIDHIDRVATVPRLLAEQGYVSFQTGKWWEGDFRRGGFTAGMSLGGRHGDEGLLIGRDTMKPIYDFVDEAQRDGKPFFVWYAPMLPHSPHNPPKRLLDHYLPLAPTPAIAKYWAMIEWFDETCGQLLAYLDGKGLRDNTLIVYIADNGWIQDPQKDRAAPRSKLSPYNGGLRTPIMLRWQGRIAPEMNDTLASSIDLAPTILSATGMKPLADMSGINLLDRQARQDRTTVFGECFEHNAVDIQRPATSLRHRWLVAGPMKIIVPQTVNVPDGKVELYNLASDPDENHNLANDEPQTVAKLRAQLDRWWSAAN